MDYLAQIVPGEKVLNFCGLNLSNDNLREIVDKIMSVDQEIVALNLSRNQISDVTPLCGLLEHTTSLWMLDLSRNQIGDLSPLKKALSHNTSLENLRLSHNQISDVYPLAKGLRRNTSLKVLSLSRNQIAETFRLFDELRYNYSLKVLNLAGNQIEHLPYLSHPLQLEELDLSKNQITHSDRLVGFLGWDSSLRILDLGRNLIEDISPLVDGLRNNSSLEKLWLYDNNISEQNMKDMIDKMLSIDHLCSTGRRYALFGSMLWGLSPFQ